ncbi:UDP-glucuronosyltransferase 1A8-like [Lineus longissimus]|uniref:UDP-glucuronosyltransferase 1A8-like n=1 Tax=Lineus longissimus TaxID=88925 RepID=UPI00315C8D18
MKVAESKKVLFLPASSASHLMQMDSLAVGLVARGYEVVTILNSRTKTAKGIVSSNVKVIEFDSGVEPMFQTRVYQEMTLAPELTDLGLLEKIKLMSKKFALFQSECRGAFLDKNLHRTLEREKFDFVVVDAIMRCYIIIPFKLGVPFGVFSSFLMPDIPHTALQSPFLVSGPLDDMVSDGDLPSLLIKLGKLFFITGFAKGNDVFGDICDIPINELQRQTKLWLYDVSTVLATPMPVSPNVINVGGLNVRRSKYLPEGELKQFVDGATDGFVLVSFGSIAKFLPDNIVSILLETFRDVPYKIVWKWDKNSLKTDQVLSSNVFAVNWIPQNDVLGHRNIKLFVTHCGNSGQHEALYNSVPMVGLPLFGDQMFNCKRIEGRFGRHIRAKDLSKDKLLHLIKQVISDRKYSDNIKKASAIFRDQPMEPRETAAYWIDHVIKYGADHLLSKTNEMSWIQILMWDVMFVVCIVALVACSFVFLVCRCVYRRCCCKNTFYKEKPKQL